MKTTHTTLWALLLLTASWPLKAQFIYATNSGTLTLSSYTGSGGVAVIPASTNNLPVTSIGVGAFSNVTSLTGVTIPRGVTSVGDYAFAGCANLTGVYFGGDAPAADATVFAADSNATVYYLPNAAGWTAPFAGLPALQWNPLFQTSGANFGVQNNQFGFNITGPTNMLVAVETCSNLASPLWTPIQTFTLTNGLAYFSEPWQSNEAARYYGLGFPTQTEQTNSSSASPILRWKLNEGSGTTVNDSSGNSYTATFQGSPLPVWVAHGTGISTPSASAPYAASCEANLTGNNFGYIQGGADVTQMGGARHASLSCWIYTRDNTDYACCGFNSDGSFTYTFGFDYDADENLCYVGVCDGAVTFSTINIYGGTAQWVHVVITYDGTQSTAANRVVAYVNAAAQAQTPVFGGGNYPATLPTAAQLGWPALAYGAGGQPGAYTYAGAYCDFQVFDVTLTQAEVTALYNAKAQ